MIIFFSHSNLIFAVFYVTKNETDLFSSFFFRKYQVLHLNLINHQVAIPKLNFKKLIKDFDSSSFLSLSDVASICALTTSSTKTTTPIHLLMNFQAARKRYLFNFLAVIEYLKHLIEP
jgi:hypothetical protein